jgi:ABC-type sugar transport system ATPase subunit
VLRGGENVLGGDPGELDDDALIAAMLGRRVERLYPPTPKPKPRTAMTVAGLRARGLTGPIDLTVSAGEILGIGGLQGQGQRELLLALGGGKPWQTGAATIGGRRYQPKSPADALAAGVAYVPEDRQREGLFLGHTVRNNITAASLDRYTRRGLLDRAREDYAARAGAARVGVDAARLSHAVQAMSGGNQQKVVLAKAVITEPQVLLLHDCTRGVDVGTKAEIFSLMATIAEGGTAILFYSSDLSELVHMCSRVAVVVEGRIRGVLDHEALSEDAILRIAVGHQLVNPEGRSMNERQVMA